MEHVFIETSMTLLGIGIMLTGWQKLGTLAELGHFALLFTKYITIHK